MQIQIRITCGENARENGGACGLRTYGDNYSVPAVSNAKCKEKIGPALRSLFALFIRRRPRSSNGHDRKLVHGSDNLPTTSGRQGNFRIELRHQGIITRRGGNENTLSLTPLISPDLVFCTESSVWHAAVSMYTQHLPRNSYSTPSYSLALAIRPNNPDPTLAL